MLATNFFFKQLLCEPRKNMYVAYIDLWLPVCNTWPRELVT